MGGPLPAVLGVDGAGVVEAAGPGVTRFKEGDEVYFVDGGYGPVSGTYQEVRIVDERLLARKPERLSFVEAAAAPLVTITAWEAINGRARVQPGQRVLVQAGAGGVGHLSVQIARLAGARVATTVSPGQKTELASSLGAELCIDYTREDVGARLREWTRMDGADVVHDTVGGKTFTACFSLVRPYGDLVSNVESPWEDEAITTMRNRNLRVSFTWMPAPQVFGWQQDRERQRGILEQAATRFDAGELRVQVGRLLPGWPVRVARPGCGTSGGLSSLRLSVRVGHTPSASITSRAAAVPEYCCCPVMSRPSRTACGLNLELTMKLDAVSFRALSSIRNG
jgi:NADPH2:quinone reductase